MNAIWTDAERNYIANNAGRLTDVQISIELSRITARNISIHAVRKQRYKLNIAKEHGRGICKVSGVSPKGLPLRITGGGHAEI